MKEPSDARKRTLALQDRALRFSNNINQSYPTSPVNYPSEVVWEQLVRAGDGTSSNLIEAGDGSSDADFPENSHGASGECVESATLGLEQEADELCAIYSTIITNMEKRLARERERRSRRKV